MWLGVTAIVSVLSVLFSGDFLARTPVAEALELRSELTHVLSADQAAKGFGRMASNDAEGLAYVLGVETIYLPRNCTPEDKAFRSWMKRWQPRYLVVPAAWDGPVVRSAELGELMGGKYRLLDGCRLSMESCQDG